MQSYLDYYLDTDPLGKIDSAMYFIYFLIVKGKVIERVYRSVTKLLCGKEHEKA